MIRLKEEIELRVGEIFKNSLPLTIIFNHYSHIPGFPTITVKHGEKPILCKEISKD